MAGRADGWRSGVQDLGVGRLGRGAALALLAAALAGCAGAAGDKDVVKLGDGSQVELATVAPTATTGAISGVVVDEAIRPVAGARVALSGGAADPARTTAEGLFTFDGLEPGLYTLQANGTGFLAAQTTAEVKAGQVAKVRMVLPTDATPQPWHTTLKFEGFVQAGNGLVDQAYQLFVKDVTGVDFCQCQFYYVADAYPESQIVEVAWEPSLANPAGASSGYWAIWDDNTTDYFDDGCDNPCLGRVDGSWQEDARNFHTDIWLDSDWVQYQQSFDEYVTLFYREKAPMGWSFVAGDT